MLIVSLPGLLINRQSMSLRLSSPLAVLTVLTVPLGGICLASCQDSCIFRILKRWAFRRLPSASGLRECLPLCGCFAVYGLCYINQPCALRPVAIVGDISPVRRLGVCLAFDCSLIIPYRFCNVNIFFVTLYTCTKETEIVVHFVQFAVFLL